MAWARAKFKGKDVWAEVDADGAPLAKGGRIAIRYSDKAGATIYQAGAGNVEPTGGAAQELPEGAPAADGVGRGTPAGPPGARPAPSGAPAAGPRPSGRGSGFGSAGSRTAAQATAARAAATQQVAAAAAAAAVRCFTDGACTGNPGPAGSGLLMKFPDGRTVEKHRALGFSTNNVGELTAIEMALDELAAAGVGADEPVVIFSDSQYARGVLVQGWKAKANVELITGIRQKLRARPGATLQWVAGHVGLPENERADALARRGVEESRRRG